MRVGDAVVNASPDQLPYPPGISTTPIDGVVIFTGEPRMDSRGRFARFFDRDGLAQVHQGRPIVQINHSLTHKVGTVRGMHFQDARSPEAKWVRCLRGRVLDVAVDLRQDSSTFMHHFAIELSPETESALFIPEGCAHGFQVLSADSELLYLHSAPYRPDAEGGLRYDDPRLAINWPLPPTELSDRDMNFVFLDADFEGLKL